jgi:hypothetical protein
MQVFSISMIYIRAKFQEDLNASTPVAGTRMEWSVAETVDRSYVCPALHQPARQFVGTLIKRQCRLFTVASTRIDVICVEENFQLSCVARLQQFFEILRQLFLFSICHRSSKLTLAAQIRSPGNWLACFTQSAN